jgi:hypothetical protein
MLSTISINDTDVVDALALYASSITNSDVASNSNYTLSINKIYQILGRLNRVNLISNSSTSLIMVQQLSQDDDIFVLGASFTHGVGGTLVNTLNGLNVNNSNISAAAILNNQSLTAVTALNMFIIDTPSVYTNIDNSSDKTLVSSIIVVAVQRNNSVSTFMNISLYFRVLNEYKPNVSATYLCSFYDPNTSKWNESGCTIPFYNQQFNRYECSCNHLSTFALVWSSHIISCNTSTQVLLSNGTCISKTDGQVCSQIFRLFVFYMYLLLGSGS